MGRLYEAKKTQRRLEAEHLRREEEREKLGR
jgi:hypothetical protein